MLSCKYIVEHASANYIIRIMCNYKYDNDKQGKQYLLLVFMLYFHFTFTFVFFIYLFTI